MLINDYVNGLSFSSELPKINKLLSSKAEATITFCGTRAIKVSGYEGSITLDELSSRILNTRLRNRSEDENGIKFIDSVINFYHITDDKVKQSSWFTQILSKTREFPLFDKPLRHQLCFLRENIEFPEINIEELKENAIIFVEGKDYSSEILSYINTVIVDESFQRSPKYFMDQWRKSRGFTEEFRIVEDSARMFFEQELHM